MLSTPRLRVRSTTAGMATAAAWAFATFLAAPTAHAGASDASVTVGLGSYHTKTASGILSSEPQPPAADWRTGAAAARAAPTNQWFTSAMFNRWSQALHAHPMTYRANDGGFEIGMPERHLDSAPTGRRELRYPHVAALVVTPLAFKAEAARLTDFSDWLAALALQGAAGESLTATVLHGSPYSYYEISGGDVRIHLAGAATMLADPASAGADKRVAAFVIGGHAYAIFGPTGATWDFSQPTDIVLHLPAERRYFSIAGLPDAQAATIAEFATHAYAFPVKTQAEWAYDPKTSTVRTTYRVDTVAREGRELTSFMGLYPHQWSAATPQPDSHYHYDSVRGQIRLIAANAFTVERRYHGIVPEWAGLEDPAHRAAVDSLLVGDLAKSGQMYHKNNGVGTYWVGKGLGAAAQLMCVADAEGRAPMRDQLRGEIEARLESWFDGRHGTHFSQDERIGTFIGIPQEFESVTAMNDHHFHYGYWLAAAAHVALLDPDWASQAKWGGMVDKLIADIATDERGRSDFPFLRNFDTYEGHSWASGNAFSPDGNNQESSSEAVNAWASLILWGEATGNQRVRDLGIYLYTSEIASIQTYWFDLNHEVLAPEFGKPFASMIFGGKYAYNTWWTEEPRQIVGINMVPFTPASLYLGAKPDWARQLLADLPAEQSQYASHGVNDGTPKDIWQDVLASFLALADPDAGLARWNKQGTVELGETRSHTLYWLLSLEEMGTPDFSVSADTALYSVFKDASGRYTYLAYNAGAAPLDVRFSTGKLLSVPPRSLARSH